MGFGSRTTTQHQAKENDIVLCNGVTMNLGQSDSWFRVYSRQIPPPPADRPTLQSPDPKTGNMNIVEFDCGWVREFELIHKPYIAPTYSSSVHSISIIPIYPNPSASRLNPFYCFRVVVRQSSGQPADYKNLAALGFSVQQVSSSKQAWNRM